MVVILRLFRGPETKVLDINDLWESPDEREWLVALNCCWLTLADRKDHKFAESIHTVDLEYVRGLGVQEWYDFLIKYFHWQFAGNHLQQRLRDLDRNSFEHLFSVKCSLVAIDESDLVEARKCLNLVRSPRIRGLEYPGASGLLALLFRKGFGAADNCVLGSLCRIESLPEKRELRDVRKWVTTKNEWRERDAALLIAILRRKAAQLNASFGTNRWTPSSISMILSTSPRTALRGCSW